MSKALPVQDGGGHMPNSASLCRWMVPSTVG